jgi:3-hydroxyisobutyrate dehydrogenase-like beta-hydroxyacid dehydrogenase
MKLGFVGLGKMGKHMAFNMLKSGDELIVNDTRTDDFPEFEKKGARTTAQVDAVAQADIIFLSLPNSQIVKDVLLGESGLIHKLGEGHIVVDLSTITYTSTLEIAKHLEDRSIAFLDAPVSGLESRAADGTLTVMCGGRREVFDEVKPYLDCIGNNILYMGSTGNGQLTKLVNQLLYDINVAALAEILPMAVKMGLDPAMVGQVVNSGTGRSHASEFFIPRILKGSFSESYSLKNAYKDLVSAAEISANLGIPLPVLHAATTTYQMALLRGLGDQDKGAMICVFEELLGIKYRSR